MCSNKEKEVLLSVIDKYKDMPYLWEKKHREYMNKDVRAEGFKVLLEIYKTFDEKATIKTIKKKIENMRTYYAKEMKKVSRSKHTGARVDEYVPTLWYFNNLSFLGNRIESCQIVTDSLENELDEDFKTLIDDSESVSTLVVPHYSAHSKMTQKRERDDEVSASLAVDPLETSCANVEASGSSKTRTEFDIFAEGVALQLNSLPLADALQLQLEMQALVTQHRLKRLKGRPCSHCCEDPSGPLHKREPPSAYDSPE